MKKYWILSVILGLGVSCKSEHEEVYDFVEICQNNYYEGYGINAADTLLAFEEDLITYHLLEDASYTSYYNLLQELSSEVYFDSYPIRISPKAPLLTLNPQDLQSCLSESFGIDSLRLTQTPYYALQSDLNLYYTSSENIHISGVFDRYMKHLDALEFEHPFIRLEILKLLYRWYFESERQKAQPL